MKIVILSDTHIPKKSKQIPSILKKHLRHANHIFHLGDWQTVELYNELRNYAPLDGIAGNVDDANLSNVLGIKKLVQIHGFTFGLVHGHLGKGRTTEERAYNTFCNESVDAILFGHSHIPIIKKIDNITLFNPGSPTDKRRQSKFSFGLLEVSRELYFQHIFF